MFPLILRCELWPPSDTGTRFRPDLVCHPFDDHPEFFFAIAFFRIVNFFLTRDLDPSTSTEMTTTTTTLSFFSLNTIDITKLREPPMSHWSSDPISLSLSPLSNNRSDRSPFSFRVPNSFKHVFQNFPQPSGNRSLVCSFQNMVLQEYSGTLS